jgi:phosphoribosylaminoimidazole-succinocarboxamide synthase
MQFLDASGIRTHFVELVSDTDSIVDALQMFPIESVVRNVAAGGFTKRFGIEEGTVLPTPIQEFFLKNDVLHDPMVSDSYITAFQLASQDELEEVRKRSHRVASLLSDLFRKANIQLVDFKLEFGTDLDGNVVLGDELTFDGMRIWDMETKKRFDKDRFRKDMGMVVESYIEAAQRLGVKGLEGIGSAPGVPL